MGVQEISERDWKIYKSKIANWQEKYMDNLCREYIALLSSDMAASDKFWSLADRIKEDKGKTGVIAENRRSKMLLNLYKLICEGALCFILAV